MLFSKTPVTHVMCPYQKVAAAVPVGLHGEGGCEEVGLALDQRGYHAVDGAVRHEGAPVAVLAPVDGRREVHLQPKHFHYFFSPD